MLIVTIGLPYFMLFGHMGHARARELFAAGGHETPYRLLALSNAGSLLLALPQLYFCLEPNH